MAVSTRGSYDVTDEKRVVKSALKRRRNGEVKRRHSDISTSVGDSSPSPRFHVKEEEHHQQQQIRSLLRLLPPKFAFEEHANTYLRIAEDIFFRGGNNGGAKPSPTRRAVAVAEAPADRSRFGCFVQQAEVDGAYSPAYFGERLGAVFRAQKPAYIMALCYLCRIVAKAESVGFPVEDCVFLRLVCGLLMVATKFGDDLYYTNDYYAGVLRLPVEVFNEMEREILWMLDYRLAEKDAYMRMSARFEGVGPGSGAPLLDVPTPISPELLLYINKFGVKQALALNAAPTIMTLDIQDTLASRQYESRTYQTQAEYSLHTRISSKSKHINYLLKQALASVKY